MTCAVVCSWSQAAGAKLAMALSLLLTQSVDKVFCFHARILQEKLDQPVSAPPSPRDVSMEIDSPENMMRHIRFLKNEVERLKKSLRTTELQRKCLLSPWHPTHPTARSQPPSRVDERSDQ